MLNMIRCIIEKMNNNEWSEKKAIAIDGLFSTISDVLLITLLVITIQNSLF